MSDNKTKNNREVGAKLKFNLAFELLKCQIYDGGELDIRGWEETMGYQQKH